MRIFQVIQLCLCLVTSGYICAAEIKCATVNMEKLLSEYHIAKKEISILQVEKYQYEKENQKLIQEIERTETQLKSLIKELRDKNISEKKRENLLRKYENLTSQYNALNKAIQGSRQDLLRELNTKMATTQKKYLEEIQTTVNKYAKAKKYQWVIDTSGNSSTKISPLIFAKNNTDITDDIITELNKDAPQDASDTE